MPANQSNGGRGGPWRGGAGPDPDITDLVRQGQERLKQILPPGGPSGAIGLVLLAVAIVGAWTAFYTVPSDSVAVVQRFGKYLKDVPPGLHFKLPLGIDVATIVPVKRQLKQEFGFSDPGRHRSVPEPAGRQARDADGDRRPERRAGRVGGPVPHLGSGEVPLRGAGTERDAPLRLRIGHAGSRRRSHRGRGHHHRPPGDRIGSADQDAGALDQVRDGDQHRPGAAEEHQSARTGAGVVQRGQPGPAGEGEADQRGAARLQQGDPAGRGREGSADPRGRRLPAQADQRSGRRRRPFQRPAGGVQQGPGGHAPPHLYRDAAGRHAGDPLQDHRRRRDAQHPAPAEPRRQKEDRP